MRKVLYAIILLSFQYSEAQVFWTENFGIGCSQNNPASSYVGPNGAWSVITVLSSGAGANNFFVSATEAGMGNNNCGDGCLSNSTLDNRTLHVGSVPNSYCGCFGCPAGDCGAAYDDCNVDICSSGGTPNTDRRAESPVINCSAQNNVMVSFLYMLNGSGTNDDASVWFFDGSTWVMFMSLAKTPTTCAPQGRWATASAPLPVTGWNNPNVKIGFRWVNNADGVGTDPSFAVDDITLSNTSGITENPFLSIEVSPNPFSDQASIVFHGLSSLDDIPSITLTDLQGKSYVVIAEKKGNELIIKRNGLSQGIYFLGLRHKNGSSGMIKLIVIN